MSTLAFTLIVISAVMHALWNLLVKRSRHKTVFIWWMFVASSALFTVTIPFLPERFRWPDPSTFLLVTAGAVCFVLYHLLNGRAYRGGDLSVVYPLSQTSMVYVPVWGMSILGERLSMPGVAGILLVILGAFSVQMERISLDEFLRPFRNLGSSTVQNALAAGFIYSLGSIAEKVGVRHYSPLYFTYFLVLIMLGLMSVNLLRSCYRPLVVEELREHWRLILISGPIMMASFLTFRYGLNLSPMSYAVPVRQVSILMGVLIGILFLGESCGRIRLGAALVILAGAVMIRLG
ncbi:EamA family transporter [Geobacter benzoatilyticus]|uniref:EamA family transporter n=1 Tax=Geobacter benzoatilyticus TaxID=2815309 RepID=A0ABX7Q5E8_9BACT|nr:EamA family transporter [Geobacter benzoatilyticus]QSV46215.1 EamA family transporter [Geobacter benzoatilyticus]